MYTSAIPKKICLTPPRDTVVKNVVRLASMSVLIGLVSFSMIQLPPPACANPTQKVTTISWLNQWSSSTTPVQACHLGQLSSPSCMYIGSFHLDSPFGAY